MNPSTRLPTRLPNRLRASMVGIACMLAACTTQPPAPMPPPPAPPPPKAEPAVPPAPPSTGITSRVSYASTPREYRRDGATHLYAKNSERIYPGKMPPLLHAVAVLQVDINGQGAVTGLRWMRAPSHAPEVVAEIERAVRSAAPFPAPIKLGHVTYTDTWLWHKSGRFQLDTLTEGQL